MHPLPAPYTAHALSHCTDKSLLSFQLHLTAALGREGPLYNTTLLQTPLAGLQGPLNAIEHCSEEISRPMYIYVLWSCRATVRCIGASCMVITHGPGIYTGRSSAAFLLHIFYPTHPPLLGLYLAMVLDQNFWYTYIYAYIYANKKTSSRIKESFSFDQTFPKLHHPHPQIYIYSGRLVLLPTMTVTQLFNEVTYSQGLTGRVLIGYSLSYMKIPDYSEKNSGLVRVLLKIRLVRHCL